MSQQEIRRQARRELRERQIRIRRERDEKDHRCSELGVSAVVALGQRDEAVAQFERDAAHALARLLQVEGLSLPEACEWAGDIQQVEARRLLRTYPQDDPNGTRSVDE